MVTQAETGRNGRKREIPHDFRTFPDLIPNVLKQDDCWMCGDRRKAPMVAAFGRARRASSTNPETWRGYSKALAVMEAGNFPCIGRAIVAPYVGIDIDECRSPQTGETSTEALEILATLNSYSELSPSLTGVKVWIEADIPQALVKPGLEIYPAGRWFTVTGHILPQYPATVEKRQAEIEEVIRRFKPQPKARRSGRSTETYTGPGVNLDEILDRVEVLGEARDASAEAKYKVVCPWVSEHSGGDRSGTYVGRYGSGAPWFYCHHAHCVHRRWRDFRNKIDPPEFGRHRRAKVYVKGEAVITLD
jgi:primase-polymerase (primpol)-like protein